MARIPKAFIDQLLERLDIVEVVNDRVPLKRQGAEYSACCPFHDEKTPSFTVSPSKQFYHCFGCGAHGTAFDFVMEYEHLNFPEAIEELARSVGMPVPKEVGTQEPEQQLKPIYEINSQAKDFYCAQLRKHPEASQAVDYLKGRGLSGETAAGRYPVQAVHMMDRINRQTEAYMYHKGSYGDIREVPEDHLPLPPANAAARSLSLLSRDLKVRAIVVMSQTGVTAAIVSATRPAAPVLAVSWEPDAVSRMNLMWGVLPQLAEPNCQDEPEKLARQLVLENQLAEPGDHVLLARGFRALGEGVSMPSIVVLTI